MDKVSVYVIHEREVECIISGMLGKEAYINSIGKLNEVVFEGDSYISEALLPLNVGFGDGMSIIISDFLTDNNFEDAINYLADKRRDVFCIQILSPEELNPKARGKMHFFDSENGDRFYRKNINRDIIKAYKMALDYSTGRIRECCGARGADYMLCSSADSVTEIFFNKLVTMGVLK